jgi:hypothetical protein
MNVVEWAKAKVEAYIANRQQAYKRTFDPTSQSADIVLRDIAKFCRAGQTVFHADPRIHAVLTGRQEVWLRIQQHINLSAEKLYDIYGGPKE